VKGDEIKIPPVQIACWTLIFVGVFLLGVVVGQVIA
jgi:hypothetical protein